MVDRIQAYRVLLKPTRQQEQLMRQFAGACRYVYNRALALQNERREKGEKRLSFYDLEKLLTEWRHDPETAWLADSPQQSQQQKLIDLDRAFKNFFAKRAGFPKFKKKGVADSFCYNDKRCIKVDRQGHRLYLPKLDWIRYRFRREILGETRYVTVVNHCGRWYASIVTKREVETPINTGEPVGIDLGVRRFATLSNGTFYEPLNSLKRYEKALRKAQQAMSRKTKGSNNWKKAKRRVQKVHARIANARRAFLHRISTQISKNHAVVCIEDLDVKNMTASASGTKEHPGKNVRLKSALNKSIIDQGWAEFRRQLDYKEKWYGGALVVVPPENTSRTCPKCGFVSADNRKAQDIFECVKCGFKEHADLVGAINILRRAESARIACQVSGERPPATGTVAHGNGAAW